MHSDQRNMISSPNADVHRHCLINFQLIIVGVIVSFPDLEFYPRKNHYGFYKARMIYVLVYFCLTFQNLKLEVKRSLQQKISTHSQLAHDLATLI